MVITTPPLVNFNNLTQTLHSPVPYTQIGLIVGIVGRQKSVCLYKIIILCELGSQSVAYLWHTCGEVGYFGVDKRNGNWREGKREEGEKEK